MYAVTDTRRTYKLRDPFLAIGVVYVHRCGERVVAPNTILSGVHYIGADL